MQSPLWQAQSPPITPPTGMVPPLMNAVTPLAGTLPPPIDAVTPPAGAVPSPGIDTYIESNPSTC